LILEALRIPSSAAVRSEWPFSIPGVRQIVDEGLHFESSITFLVGENGSGKSTLVEAIAEAYGIDVRGGHGGRRYGTAEPISPLGKVMELRLAPRSERGWIRKGEGFLLRSETAFGVFQFMSDKGVSGYGETHLGRLSHGEGYLQVLNGRFKEPGLLLMDEPEAPLSFQSCLALIRVLKESVTYGSQIICATHSPILAATPGAMIIELSESGLRRVEWDELEMVDHWRHYLDRPGSYLRHLEDEDQ